MDFETFTLSYYKTLSVLFCSMIVCGILFALINHYTMQNHFMRDMYSFVAILGGIFQVLLISHLAMIAGNPKSHIGNNDDLQ